MPAKKLDRVATRPRLLPAVLGDPSQASRLLSDHAAAVSQVEQRQASRSQVTVSLVVGANTVNTNLGRRAIGCNLTPVAAASTSFAWSFAASGDAQAIITIVGVAQPSCPLEFY